MRAEIAIASRLAARDSRIRGFSERIHDQGFKDEGFTISD
jgi:hypothetical protein